MARWFFATALFSASLYLSLTGCFGDVVETSPIAATPTPAAPTCSPSNTQAWYDPTTNIPYVDDISTSISFVTFYLTPLSNQSGVYSTTVEARACGPTGTLLGSATSSGNLTVGNNTAVTFNFASVIYPQSCGGKSTIAFKFINNQANLVGVSGQPKSSSTCTIQLGYDSTSTPPTNPNGIAVTGSITP